MTATTAAREDVGAANRFPGIDGLRAIAVAGVLLVHVGLISGYAARTRDGVGPYIARAEAGVALFFLVSGFLLYRPFVAAAFDGRPGPGLRSYARRRVLRIVPAYWLALTVLAVVLDVRERGDIDSVRDVVVYYGFLQIYFDDTALGGIQQAWSLCTEAAFYVTLPLWAAALRRLGRRWGGSDRGRLAVELGALALLYLGGLASRWLVVRDRDEVELTVNWLHTNADLFALGMAVAVLEVHQRRRPVGEVGEAIGRIGGWWWVGAAASYWAVSTQVGLGVEVGAGSPAEWMWREVLYGLTALFLLLPAVFGDQERGLVRGLLRSGPLVAAGLVSYGVYLWHEGVLDLFRRARDHQVFAGPFLPQLVATVVGTAAVAVASWFVVEKPALRRK